MFRLFDPGRHEICFSAPRYDQLPLRFAGTSISTMVLFPDLRAAAMGKDSP